MTILDFIQWVATIGLLIGIALLFRQLYGQESKNIEEAMLRAEEAQKKLAELGNIATN